MLLIDDAPFFRNMLAPVLKAAGYAVTPVARRRTRWRCWSAAGASTSSLPTSRCPAWTASSSLRRVRGNPRTADVPIIGLSSLVSAEAIERGKRVGLHDYVAKFDRQGLIAALKEQTADLRRAA